MVQLDGRYSRRISIRAVMKSFQKKASIHFFAPLHAHFAHTMVFVLITQVAAIALLASSSSYPYLTQATSTVTWTESALPSATPSSTST
ncbi:hypothetical protein FIBSPDRAFT_1054121 [Athelia psychrophila]|uniref:Uncharacterized protein n=1 Tax=Athelia psychrophila TaxID=1759441 RepID=A0A167VU17_9AGAM|nr:hypothetical protein FIBSPDRAFT_1054121 [Fibularhizoctonia sp. CBS 109695]